MKNQYIRLSTYTSIVAVAIATSTAAFAQEAPTAPAATENANSGITDIVVTAQKREQRLQDVPVAISAVTATSLATNRVTSVRDLDSIAPNLTVRQIVGGSALPSYSMRGESTIGTSLGVDRGIGVYVDGVYLGNAQGSVFELGDIQRIEVLRGPQGTLFGRNSTGGAISIITADPKGEFGVKQTLTYGNYDQFRSLTHVDTPAFGDFSASFNFVHSERRGDIRNLGGGTTWDFTAVNGKKYTSPDYLGGYNTEAASANLLYNGDKIRAIYKFDWSNSTQTAPGQGVIYMSPLVRSIYAAQPAANLANLTQISRTRPDAVNNAGTVPSHIKTQGHNLTVSADLTDNLSVKNIAAFRKSSFESPLAQLDGMGGLVNPGSAVPNLALLLGGTAAANATIGAPLALQPSIFHGKDSQFSNEIQFNYNSHLVTVTVGGLYFRQKSVRGWIGDGRNAALGQARSGSFQVFPNFTVPGPRALGYGGLNSHVRMISTAVFGQAEFHVLDNVDLVGGVRYTHDNKKGIDNTIVSASAPAATNSFPIRYSAGKVTYNLGVNYKPTSDILLYGKYSTGFISGGFFSDITFDPQEAKSWEAGIKADWFGRKLRTNLSLFSVKYTGLQLTTNGRNVGITNPNVGTVVVNAGDARAKGFELETTLQPLRQVTLNASLGYTDFKYTKIDPRIASAVDYLVASDRSKWTSSLSAQYESDPVWGDATVIVRVDGNYKSKQQKASSIPLTSGSNLSLFGITPAEQAALIDAQHVPGYWLVNGRIALQNVDFGGAKATLALWGRNLFDTKQISYAPSLVYAMSADYERARTYGVDLTVEF